MPAKKQAKPKSSKSSSSKKTIRKIDKPKYRSFRLQKRIKHDAPPLPKARKMFASAWRHIVRNKKLFIGILVIQVLLTLVLVKGFGLFSSDFGATKDIVQEVFEGDSILFTAGTLLGVLVTSVGDGSTDTANVYGSIIVLVGSLAIIWSLRQTHAKSKPSIKQAYYNSMYPLVPFVLVLMVILLQLVPLIIGNVVYSIVVSNGLAVTVIEQALWLLLFISSGLLSLYMLSSSLFAMYIVTLPDMPPMKALRAARKLVLHRRALIARKLLFLPFVLLVITVLVMLPVIIYLAAAAEALFFVLTTAGLFLVHAYVYELYRELL